ncbi:MAG: cob(I)yrinic acid a,c-diamide adenosyltransferase [Gammaproteobacteria bacterium]|nr:cob(I)yrinic acid a,c-diamide adenosyltransferase [Gammaproteobacteria bacterium]MCK5092054.1 cob(I)yrinic acid a,c-diamide adenosyltransferase [Gammaproteobacteria bacterium]
MGNRLSKIYTRTGDKGTTGLGDGSRIEKDNGRMEAIGCVDELNSIIGIVLACEIPESIQNCLAKIQHELFDLGGELSIPGHVAISDEHIKSLEENLDKLNSDLPPLKEFILPGGTLAAAHCHHARTVCRRAERDLLRLSRTDEANHLSLIYLNRLSDFLFVAARVLARSNGGKEVLWRHDRTRK